MDRSKSTESPTDHLTTSEKPVVLSYFEFMCILSDCTPSEIPLFRDKLEKQDQEIFDKMSEDKQLILCGLNSINCDKTLLNFGRNLAPHTVGLHDMKSIITVVLYFRKRMKQQELL